MRFPMDLYWQGDEVLAVNGEDVKGKSAFEVSSLLQGPSQSFVIVKVALYEALQLCSCILCLILTNISIWLHVLSL